MRGCRLGTGALGSKVGGERKRMELGGGGLSRFQSALHHVLFILEYHFISLSLCFFITCNMGQ